jgi:hypothetical protein
MAEEKKDHKKKAHAGHGFSRSHVENHADGSHTVHHEHSEGPHKDVKHAVADLDGVHDSLQDHLGMPNPGEAEANAGPSPAAAPAPATVPAAPAPAGPMGA